MKISCLCFTSAKPIKPPERRTLDVDSPQAFEQAMRELPVAVHLVRVSDLANMREFKEMIIDRGTKNKHKGLTEYLLGRGDGKVQMIDGNYNDVGQLKRGINTLLANAELKKERNAFIIGVNQELFREIWDDGDRIPVAAPVRSNTETYCSSADQTSGFLQEIIARCAIPPGLKDEFIGASPEADQVRMWIMIASQNDAPVLIQGDTGTGKEVVARQTHKYSKQRLADRFFAINCGAIPKELFESELFGYEPGSYTGAGPRLKKGLWELADKGTLFLDEIGDLQLNHQVKILRALEDGCIKRVGGVEDIKVSTRIIAATNRDLQAMVRDGQFREDLYYRLRGLLIRTPALRDHKDDVPLLAQFFWNKTTKGKREKLPDALLNELGLYGWPGNARELRMVLNTLNAIFPDDGLKVEQLKFVFNYAGHGFPVTRNDAAEKSMAVVKADCWRHLKKVDDVVHATRQAIQSIMKSQQLDKSAVDSFQETLAWRIGELERLCQERLLFHTEQTFGIVRSFREDITRFQRMLREEVPQAREYWDKTLAGECEAVLSAIFREGEGMLGKG